MEKYKKRIFLIFIACSSTAIGVLCLCRGEFFILGTSSYNESGWENDSSIMMLIVGIVMLYFTIKNWRKIDG